MEESVLMDRFLADVKVIVEKDLNNSFDELRKDLIQLSESKGLSTSKHKEIQQCTHKLLKVIKKNSKTNIQKFELYALKNIFAPSTVGENSTDTQQQHDLRMEEIEKLRQRYAELNAQNSFLREEASASEVLLSQMNKTIFDLRVGAQALDAHEVKPLDYSVAAVTQRHNDLVQLQQRAQGLTGEILSSIANEEPSSIEKQKQIMAYQQQTNGGYDSGVMDYQNDEEDDDDDIDTIDAEDIRQLNDLLK